MAAGTRIATFLASVVVSFGIANGCAAAHEEPLPAGALGELIAYQIGTARGERPLAFAYRYQCFGDRLAERISIDSIFKINPLESQELRRRLTNADNQRMDRALTGQFIHTGRQFCDSILAIPLTPKDSTLLKSLLKGRSPEK